MLTDTTVALIGALLTFVAAALGTFIHWRRTSKDDVAQFRADLMKMNQSFQEEIKSLREKVAKLESDLYEKAKQIAENELYLIRIKRLLLEERNIDLDELLEKDRAASG